MLINNVVEAKVSELEETLIKSNKIV